MIYVICIGRLSLVFTNNMILQASIDNLLEFNLFKNKCINNIKFYIVLLKKVILRNNIIFHFLHIKPGCSKSYNVNNPLQKTETQPGWKLKTATVNLEGIQMTTQEFIKYLGVHLEILLWVHIKEKP